MTPPRPAVEAPQPGRRLDPGTLDHPADLYNPVGRMPTVPGLDAVGDAELEFYRQHGWLAVADVFTPAQVADALQAIDDLIAGRNERFNNIVFESAAKDALAELSANDRLDKIRKLAAFVGFDERLECLASDAGLTALVGGLMDGRAPRLFQDMALLKPPKIGREKPWHQDQAYFDLALTDRIVGVWIALDEATLENGCMQVIDGGHKLGPIHHWQRRDWQICDTMMQGKTSLACPLRPGGVLFFDSLLPHGTPTNHSAARRRALQFHYCNADAQSIPQEQRLALFGTEGKDVTC